MEYTLTMTFLTETGEKSNISISDVKAGITNDEAVALMDSLIENNIFENSKGRLVSKYSAQVTERQVTKFTV
ncbi:MAG: DUF2922 domain-containing protein [Clostridium celatum]|uniref:DUF2922 domain-containing protein n=1 Tax=uncultured Clostridium sp. TaxID=59620 RepID=UPI0025E0BD76|nr:DUF2922 domain-containing protein [uncultured Clostridium sp.]MDU2490517.1 DUF2922 domain-containing protein [Clostridium celatum]MDU4884530.1 DUF2922 domain-containing protein [Clostridium celatum]MDU5262465.1 DUF2922 domain-containing protein [Clostridium celatum]MDU7077699.1 DUF2922 domain-containing protein [Clostridium celatum]